MHTFPTGVEPVYCRRATCTHQGVIETCSKKPPHLFNCVATVVLAAVCGWGFCFAAAKRFAMIPGDLGRTLEPARGGHRVRQKHGRVSAIAHTSLRCGSRRCLLSAAQSRSGKVSTGSKKLEEGCVATKAMHSLVCT